MEIVDTHLHLWDPDTNSWYPGLRMFEDGLEAATGSRPALHRTYLTDEYRQDAASADVEVVKGVHVSAVTAPGAHLAELRWVDALCEANGFEVGLVGTVDPTRDVDSVLGELEEQATCPRFRGVRVLEGLDPSGSVADAVLSWLGEHDLTFDLVAHPSTMNEWLTTLARHPDTRVVLEHAGWPEGYGDEAHAAWRQSIDRMSQETAAFCKVSGLGMVTMDLGEAALRPWVEGCIESFGWDRVAFGSNFPIETIAGTYATLIASLRAILADATDENREAFFRTNAIRMYRL